MSGEIRGVEKGNITIGANYSVSFQWLPRILARFEEDYPQIHVQILEGCGQELRPYLEARRVDLCPKQRRVYGIHRDPAEDQPAGRKFTGRGRGSIKRPTN